MQIIVYSETDASSIRANMGKAEYSYYFILAKYLPLLESLGEVRFVRDPDAEVDVLFDEASERGETSVFLSFTPPHRTAMSLRCPTICVLAWEYDSIPDESFEAGQPWQNWVAAIERIGHVITISDYATRVIRSQVGPGTTVVTVPAPVAAMPTLGEKLSRVLQGMSWYQRHRRRGRTPIEFSGSLIDSEALNIEVDGVTAKSPQDGGAQQEIQVWHGRPVDFQFAAELSDDGQYLVGFYDQEEWGVWSRTASPMLFLPWTIRGDVELSIEMLPYGENEGRTLEVRIGEVAQEVLLEPGLRTYKLKFSLNEGASSINFSGIKAITVPSARDHRTLGIGLRTMALRPLLSGALLDAPAEKQESEPEEETSVLTLTGTVYTALFNPADGRKNWEDIVTAFCWAFRDEPDKTLLLKMSHRSKSVFLGRLLLLFSKLPAFRCRVVALHGYLSEEELAQLTAQTDYFVNASTAEGQCLPLLEFMAQGVPAIAPDHTAMETYINTANAFVVDTSKQPSMWPHDPRRANRTVSYRTNWDSLRLAFLDSARLLAEQPGRYGQMCIAAQDAVQAGYNTDKVKAQLATSLAAVAR